MLLALAVAGFAIGTSEFVPVGPIRKIVRDLSDPNLIGGEPRPSPSPRTSRAGRSLPA